jgi:cysteine-rich repeat protein
MITNVTPGNGAPGNYITIFGQYFRSNPGRVIFLGGDGPGDDKIASLADCATPWQDNQIVVRVPDGAVDGPIRVEEGTSGKNYADETNDSRGPFLPNFDVNDIIRPGLCRVEPASGSPRTEVTLTGINFGERAAGDDVTFGRTRAGSIISWANTSIHATVPNIAPGQVSVQVTKGGETSNPVNFQVTSVAEAPHILRFEPTSGPVGEYVTIYGSNFGNNVGKVEFVAPDGTTVLADTNFPEVCGTSWWKNDQVTIKVPSGATIDRPGPNWALKLTTSTGDTDDTLDLSPARFSVTTGTPKPGICLLDPDNGPEGLTVNIYGERLGTAGTVKFWRNKSAATTSWSESQITTSVPTGAETGPVNVTVGGQTSNSLNFTVRDCRIEGCPAGQECCRDGNCALSPPVGPGCLAPAGRGYYYWSFSTGEIPVYPQVVEECIGPPTPEPWPSPSPTPWSDRGQTSVCVNAMISVRFTTLINHETIANNILVQKCNDGEACTDLTPVSPRPNYPEALDINGRQTQVNFLPSGRFEADKWYQITLVGGTNEVPSGIKSCVGVGCFEGYYLDGDKDGREGGNYVFKFKTRPNTDPCEVGRIGVQPYQETAEEEGEQIAYLGEVRALGDGCLLLDPSVYSWIWRVDDPDKRGFPLASVESGWCLRGSPPTWTQADCTSDHARVTANLETVPGSPVKVVGRIPAENKEGFGNLIIDFTDPKVVEKWPDCREACINAAVGARFNTRMNRASFANNVKLYLWKCGNGVLEPGEDCDDGNIRAGDGCSERCLNEGTTACTTPATQLNCCGNGRRETGEDCDGVPFPSGCSERCLNQVEGRPSTTVCGNGAVEEGEDCDDGNTNSGDGCSSSCLNEGTTDLAQISINPSYSENNRELNFSPLANLIPNTWYRAVISGQVESRSGVKLTDLNYDADKDGRIDSYSWVFKTKNDATVCSVDRVEVRPESARLYYVGATQDYVSDPYGAPDECNPNGQRLRAMDYPWDWSSQYNEVATVTNDNNYPKCGNGVVEFGEDCDDENTTSGDGCSRTCLNEGQGTCNYGNENACQADKRCSWQTTPSPARCVRASICGNGRLEIGEDCDDGNTRSGDGCNNVCLHEGSIAGGSVCGDFVVGNGEDCDDGNRTSGDGCSDTCLNEGTVVDNFRDPYQTATTVGVRQGETESTTEIRAETQRKTGKGDLTMVCGYGPSKPCPSNPPDLGVGTDSCCYFKPKIETCDPSLTTNVCSSGKTGVCRNAKITITFDQEMDDASIGGNIIIAGWGYTSCPEGATEIGTENEKKWCVGGSVATITTSTRLIKVGEITKTVVDVYLTKLLDENRKYKVIVKGDNEGTANVVEGVKSKKGVALGGTNFDFQEGGRIYKSFAWDFETGRDICVLEKVVIRPSFHLFTSSVSPANQQEFNADAEDWRGQSISPIPLVYAWTWSWASSISDTAAENVVSLSANKVCMKNIAQSCNVDGDCHDSGPCVLSSSQTATAQNRNGEEVLSATATITDDVILTPSTKNKTTTGHANVIVFICENPWPNDLYTSSGYADDDYNFKTYYCRDRGVEHRTDDDLPALSSPVINDRTPTDDTKDELLREYFFFPQGNYCSLSLTPCGGAFGLCPAGAGECRRTPDAIGIRIYENADHLSLVDWYQAQGLTFGAPASLEVDGYPAIRDGRTVYVMAANDTRGGSTLYTNVYLISYSEGANPDTIEIYNQLLANLRFNTNLINSRLCKQGRNDVKLCAGDLTRVCTADSDCQVGNVNKGPCNVLANCSRDLDCPAATNVCQAPKDKLIRDVKRILDLQAIASTLESYKRRVGYYPKLEAGTYIRALTASVWGSWQGVLGSELGITLPVDPINRIVNCTETGFDSITCWNVTLGQYKCPAGSHIYQYKFNPSDGSYKLQSDFEYSGDRTLWEKDLSDKFEIQNTCRGAIMQNTGVCGDGVINGEEECEVGQTKEESCTVDSTSGRQAYDCDPGTCRWRAVGGCSVLCGDGVVQLGEQCDQGPTGGRVPRGGTSDTNQYACTSTCTWTGGWCGDGQIQTAYGERCDDGSENGRYGIKLNSGHCSITTTQTCPTLTGRLSWCPSGETCVGARSYCKSDCSGFGPYCGDGIVNGREQCDGNSITSKGVCYSGSKPDDTLSVSATRTILPCDRDSDCPAGTCSRTTTQSCRTNTDCPSGETCNGAQLCAICAASRGYPQFRTLICKAPRVDEECTWNYWSACAPAGVCGNGIKEGAEECDDGNTNNNDGCIITASGSPAGPNNCKLARCGDGFVRTGVEACDAGPQNGVPCTARYGETCNYCSTACTILTRTGPGCGDGIINGSEQCDGTATDSWICVNPNVPGSETPKTLDTSSLCNQAICRLNCPAGQVACNNTGSDSDGDGLKDACDPDDDNDGCLDGDRSCVPIAVNFELSGISGAGDADDTFELWIDDSFVGSIYPVHVCGWNVSKKELVCQWVYSDRISITNMTRGDHTFELRFTRVPDGVVRYSINYDTSHLISRGEIGTCGVFTPGEDHVHPITAPAAYRCPFRVE